MTIIKSSCESIILMLDDKNDGEFLSDTYHVDLGRVKAALCKDSYIEANIGALNFEIFKNGGAYLLFAVFGERKNETFFRFRTIDDLLDCTQILQSDLPCSFYYLDFAYYLGFSSTDACSRSILCEFSQPVKHPNFSLFVREHGEVLAEDIVTGHIAGRRTRTH